MKLTNSLHMIKARIPLHILTLVILALSFSTLVTATNYNTTEYNSGTCSSSPPFGNDGTDYLRSQRVTTNSTYPYLVGISLRFNGKTGTPSPALISFVNLSTGKPDYNAVYGRLQKTSAEISATAYNDFNFTKGYYPYMGASHDIAALFEVNGSDAAGNYYSYCRGSVSAPLGDAYVVKASKTNPAAWTLEDTQDVQIKFYWADDNGTSIDTSPQITIINQNPANITAITLFSQSVNVTYNYTNSATWTNVTLNLTAYHLSGASCISFLNGSCTLQNGTTAVKNPVVQVNGSNYTTATYSFSENEIYPYNSNLPSSSFNTTHSEYTASGLNAIKIEILNHSTERYNILEIYANTTGTYRIYACNNNYTSGNFITSPWCQEIALKNNTGYNHTHANGTSKHELTPYGIINGKINGGIYVTSTMQFIIKPLTGTLSVFYVAANSRTGATQTTPSNGASWNTQTYSPDFHIHSYNGDEYINFLGIGYNGSKWINSSLTTELIDLPPLAPAPPIITNPQSTNQSSRYQNATWILGSVTSIGAAIQNYTIEVLNNNVLNATLGVTNNATTSFNYDVYNLNLSTGTYQIRVTINDSFGQTASDIEDFFLLTNTQYNLTFINAINNTLITANGTIQITTNSTATNYSVINGRVQLDLIKNVTYTLTPDITGYAVANTTFSTDTVNNTKNINVSLYTNNSIQIFIYDETTGFLINTENITITITGITETTYSTTTGSYYVDNLADGTYSIKFQSTNYSLKQYSASVGSRSTQVLNAYLSTSTQTTTFSIQDYDSSAYLEGATFSQSRLINGTWTLVNIKTSDITGRVQTTYLPNVKYRFVISYSGYNTNTFDLDPVIFSSYQVKLTKSITLTPQTTPAYTDVLINYYPTNFTTNTNHTFYFVITSPLGQLVKYNLSINNSRNVTYLSGTNLNGEIFTTTIQIPLTNLTDDITLNYCYKTTTSLNRCNKAVYSIIGSIGNYTFEANKNKSYNMGKVDKVIMGTLILVLVSGFVFAYIGAISGIIVTIFIMGYLYYMGIFSLWLILPSITLAIFVLMRSGGGNNG